MHLNRSAKFARIGAAGMVVGTLMMVAPDVAHADTAPKVTVTFSTRQTSNGRYAPKHVLAVWVEDAAGKFVRTLMKYGSRREVYLRGWKATSLDASRIASMPDVISGATRSSHAQRIVTWAQTDHAGAPMPDGTYKLRMELTDWDSPSMSGNNEGSVTFEVRGSESHMSAPDTGGFSAITVDYVPGSGGTVTPGSDAGPVRPPDGGVGPSPSPTTSPSPSSGPGMCEVNTQCVDGDGCCPLDCVYEVDHDCDPDSAHNADGAAGCDTSAGREGAPALLLVLGALLLAAQLRRRKRRF